MRHEYTEFYASDGRLSVGDRISRVLLGKAITTVPVYFVITGSMGALGWLALLPLIALYPMVTGLSGWDPLYALARRLAQGKRMPAANAEAEYGTA